MHKNKIVHIVSSLSPTDLRQLDKFVRSPAHNQHTEVAQLFQYLRKHADGGERALQREQVFQHLFPGEAFNMQRVHHVSSYLLKVLEEFLAWQDWRADEGRFQLHLLRAYQRLQSQKPFENAYKNAKKAISDSGANGTQQLRQHYRLVLERFNHDRTFKSSTKFSFKLQELSNSQDAAFIAEKLRNACILLSNQAVVNATYNIGLLSNVLEYVANHQLLDNPTVAVYYYALQTLTNTEDDRSFSKLKELLVEHSKSFNTNELHDIYIFGINYCIRRFNSGEQVFMQEVFEIYKLGMVTDSFLKNGIISPRTYSNVVMSGLRAQEHDWVHRFILDYKNALPEKQREGFFNYNLARFHYDKKDYRKAMPLLQQMEYEDVLLTCLGKILLAKMQFELDETEPLISHLQSFKTYVRRKKMLGYHRESSLNFIHFTQQLLSGQKKSRAETVNQLNETKIVAEKEWLLEQLQR